MEIKVKVMGYRGQPFPSVTERVEKELTTQGCEIDEQNPELLIHTTGAFNDAETFYKTCKKPPIKLYNLLDVNNSDPNFYNKVRLDYENCEIACTISNTAKSQIREKFQTNREIHVIGFPMRPVTNRKISRRSIPFLYVGRWNDPNKRVYLIEPTLKLLNCNPVNDLAVVGSDTPHYECLRHGIVDDDILDILYNSSEFTLLLSKKEGLGMTAIEAIAASSIPILSKDNEVTKELELLDFCSDPNPDAIVSLIDKIRKNPQYYWNKTDELGPKFQKQFSIETFVKNILDLYQEYKKYE